MESPTELPGPGRPPVLAVMILVILMEALLAGGAGLALHAWRATHPNYAEARR